MISSIGDMAGKVWSGLNNKGSMSLTKLKTTLKADAFVLDAAIGWLAREDKVNVTKSKTTVTVHLK